MHYSKIKDNEHIVTVKSKESGMIHAIVKLF